MPEVCEVCNGEGLVEFEWEAPNGSCMDAMATCDECDGTGEVM